MKNKYLNTVGWCTTCALAMLIGHVVNPSTLAYLFGVTTGFALLFAVRALIAAIPVGDKFRIKRWARRFRRTSYFR